MSGCEVQKGQQVWDLEVDMGDVRIKRKWGRHTFKASGIGCHTL